MLKPVDPPSVKGEEPEIGDTLGRLIDDTEAYVRAELKVAKAVAEAKVNALKRPSLLLAASLFFAQSALTVLAVGVALGLSPFIGPLAASFIAFLIFGGIAAVLIWVGWTKFREEL
jgi:Putative Actinobacterial Holin-X, holin superfamily III